MIVTLALACVGWIIAITAGAAAVGLRRALAERMEVVARASHELRGGIGAARLGLGLADRGKELPLRSIALELDRAAIALEDLEGRPPAWRRELVDVCQLLSDSVEVWRGSALCLRLLWTGERAAVVGDRVRLAQAIDNLIANAVEHGGGQIEVRGSAEYGAVRIEIADSGPGLSAPIAELTRSARRGQRGRGLAIASNSAGAHGGRLGAAPSEAGARLVLELPAAADGDRRSQAG